MEKKISVNGYEFTVSFDFEPYEPQTRHYPGHTESVSINQVWAQSGNEIEEWAYEMLENDLEVGCLEAVQADQLEAQLAKEEAKQEAWEAKHENDLLNM